jgi:endoglucanase
MKTTIRTHLLIFAFFIFSSQSIAQYLHRNGKEIQDGEGKPVILRGMGLGGWMLQEGYMLQTGDSASAQYQIKAKIKKLIGEENTNQFYDAWLANHCTKRDIDSLASWGFNSVRLPMHYNLYTLPIEQEPVQGQNTWLTKGFALTDSLLKWCSANKMYLILDLHAAPGGQGNDIAISDNDKSKPSLWQSEDNKKKTIALWKKLAERYASEKWMGGYDLINETNWNFDGANVNGCNETVNGPLRQLYVAITAAIREVDKNHMIYFEGNCWANNHAGLFPLWDENIAVSFHKYWNYNDQGSIQGFINLRNQYNVPVWLGESGENSNLWFTEAIRLLENNNMGWAWWPMKKVGSVVNPLTVVKNEGYDKILKYWKSPTSGKPSVQEAKAALMQLAENLKIENNIYRKDVIDAMFRQVKENSTIPFAKHTVPGIVNASDYDLGRSNKAYFDKDSATYHVSVGGSFKPWNNGYEYRNDAVDLQSNLDSLVGGNNYNIGWTEDGEWTLYTVGVDSSAAYNIDIRYAGAAESVVKIFVDGEDKSGSIQLPSTGSYALWATKTVQDVLIDEGVHKIKFYFQKGGANFRFMKFTLSKKKNEVALKAVSAETTQEGNVINVFLNKKVDVSTVEVTGFTVNMNNQSVAVSGIVSNNEANGLTITLVNKFSDADTLTINYNGVLVKAQDGNLLEAFVNLGVTNTLPLHYAIPGKIQAEDFFVNQGLVAEACADEGSGFDMGFTNIGDFLKYRIRVAEDGKYTINARVACKTQAGKLLFEQTTDEGTVLNSATINVPVTGGWQSWTTVTEKITLTKGTGVLRVQIQQPEFNFNWFDFPVISSVEKKSHGSLNVFPNPVENILNLELPDDMRGYNNTLSIRNASGAIVKKIERAGTEDVRSINLTGFATGMYLIEIETKHQRLTSKFLVK